jgi:hemerythrin-like domain-containing protein
LMVEHRLIEKVIALVANEAEQIEKGGAVNTDLIDAAVDFFRTYADRTHHGKEEDILFAQLAKKPLGDADRQRMDELVQDHVQARKAVSELYELNRKSKAGKADYRDVAARLRFLAGFYPPHIKREDDVFFPGTETYFTEAEQQQMLSAFWEFDRRMIHEKYGKVYEAMKGML